MSAYTVAAAVRKAMDFSRHIASTYSRPFKAPHKGRKKRKVKKLRGSKARVAEGQRRLRYESRQALIKGIAYALQKIFFFALVCIGVYLLNPGWLANLLVGGCVAFSLLFIAYFLFTAVRSPSFEYKGRKKKKKRLDCTDTESPVVMSED